MTDHRAQRSVEDLCSARNPEFRGLEIRAAVPRSAEGYGGNFWYDKERALV